MALREVGQRSQSTQFMLERLSILWRQVLAKPEEGAVNEHVDVSCEIGRLG
jgi:hypothetical protein